MNYPLVSIIIPIYNASATIDRTLNSIASQTYENIQVLCVDDGSTDNSSEIINKYAYKDKRFKLIQKENGGVASARQVGIDHADGEYAIHVDPDDWIDENMIEAMVTNALNCNLDIVICDIVEEKNGKQHILEQKPKEFTYISYLEGLFNNLHGSCCNKLIKYSFYKSTNFTPNINLSEDLLYICKILVKKPSLGYLPKSYYHYVQYDKPSQSKIKNKSTFYQLKNVYLELTELFKSNKIPYSVNIDSILPYWFYSGVLAEDLEYSLFIKEIRPYILRLTVNSYSLSRKLQILLATCGFKSLIIKLIKNYTLL